MVNFLECQAGVVRIVIVGYQKKSKRNSQVLKINQKNLELAKITFKKDIGLDSFVCNKCRLKLYQKSNENDTGSESSGDVLVFKDTCANEPVETVEVDVPRCTLSEKYCVVCKSKAVRPKVPWTLRLNTYFRRGFYLPNGVRCCKNHYTDFHLYDNCFNRIEVISNSSEVPIHDLKLFLKESTNRCRKSSLLQSFVDKSVSDKECLSTVGLLKKDLYDVTNRLKSLRDSKNRKMIEAVVIFLTRLRHNMSYDALATFLSFRNGQLIGHICDEVEAAFNKDVIPKYIGCGSLFREEMLRRQSETAKLLFPAARNILIADGTYLYIPSKKFE